MIRRITLDNFMSHSHSVIEPAEGLTVLVGSNNCGKSAVITALQTLCYNERGGFMMRHGETECRVSVETDEGHKLEWIRQKKSVRYIINGREVDRLKGSIPDDLHELLRLPLVESADGHGEFNIHFGEQKRPIFLLDQNGRQAAAFFASSSDAALLMEMQAAHKKRVTERRQYERTLSAEADRYRVLLATLEPVAKMAEGAAALESAHAELAEAVTVLAKLEAESTQLLAESDKVERWQRSHDELQKLETPPDLTDTEAFEELIAELDEATRSLHGELAQRGALLGLDEAPELEPAETVEVLVKQIESSQRTADYSSRQDMSLAKLQSPPELTDDLSLEKAIENLRADQETVARFEMTAGYLRDLVRPHAEEDSGELLELIGELTAASEAVAKFEVLEEQLSALDEPPAPQTLKAGTSLLTLYDSARAQVEMLTAELEAIDLHRKDALAELFAWAKENPTCPICGGAVDPDSLFACNENSSEGAAS